MLERGSGVFVESICSSGENELCPVVNREPVPQRALCVCVFHFLKTEFYPGNSSEVNVLWGTGVRGSYGPSLPE